MKTRIAKWSIFALAAVAAAFVGTSDARAEGHVSISFGRRLVRPAVVHPAVLPVATPVVHPVVHPVVSPIVVTPTPVIAPIGHPAYPYMVGFPTVRRSVIVHRTYVGRTYIGGVVRSPRFVARIGF